MRLVSSVVLIITGVFRERLCNEFYVLKSLEDAKSDSIPSSRNNNRQVQ